MGAMLAITGAAQASGVSTHTLRCYERAGLLETIDRNGSGHRRCRDDDLERIEWKINYYRERLE
jgi:DNA-binding transcriptional MerR regulator